MPIVVKLIGIIIAIIGIIVLSNPKSSKQLIAYWIQGKRLYIAGVLRIFVGTILLLVSTQCRLVAVVMIFGILILIKGLLIFILGLEKVKSILGWWDKRTSIVIRLMGLIVLAIAMLLIYSV